MYTFERTQRLPISITEAWDFFSTPSSLQIITPDYMGFNITGGFEPGEKMVEEMLITYTVKPVLGIPIKWVTLISKVEEPHLFVDEQLQGPYSVWHHEHTFKEIEGGVEMHDRISYKIKFGIFGRIANALFVKRQLGEIFDYRFKVLEERFGGF
jgi:ligand-binding SRPBCC domain-containing protein